MKKQKGFIATSLLYSFFLIFVTLFIGMVSIYLQNRVYLNKFEDSSKKSIYIREIVNSYRPGYSMFSIYKKDADLKECYVENFEGNTVTCRIKDGSVYEFKLSNCDSVYFVLGFNIYIEGEC